MSGEEYSETSANTTGEASRDFREELGRSGWTTTKQAAKVLGVSRRSVQGYVGRGLLEAKEEGQGVTKTFLVSIDSLNALRERRRREAEDTANFAEGSPATGEAAKAAPGTGEALQHAIARVEARTAEATELRVRLELTEQAESTLREELLEERRRRVEAEERVAAAEAELEALREPRESPVSPGPSDAPTEGIREAHAAREAPRRVEEPEERLSWWRRWFGG